MLIWTPCVTTPKRAQAERSISSIIKPWYIAAKVDVVADVNDVEKAKIWGHLERPREKGADEQRERERLK